MDDQLEKYIRSHRPAFEEEEPSGEVWLRIRERGGIRKNRNVYWKVAAVFFLISTLYLVVDKKINTDATGNSVGVTDMSEFNEVEAYYTGLIAQKKAEISQFDDSELKRSFFAEIDRLDVLYNELKITYKNQNTTDLLTDAMISNLKLRIRILDEQLKILTKFKNAQNDSESTIES